MTTPAYQRGAQIANELMRSQALIGADDPCACPSGGAPPSTMKALLHITLPDGDGDDPEVAEERHFAPIWLALNAMMGDQRVAHPPLARSVPRADFARLMPPLFASGDLLQRGSAWRRELARLLCGARRTA